MKNKKKTSQFPNIYRFITESKLFKNTKKVEFKLIWQSKHHKYLYYFLAFLSVLTTLIFFLGIIMFTSSFYQKAAEYRNISLERKNTEEKINFWKSIANKYEGYKDAYFQIALLEFRLGNIKNALEYNKKALLLDPNFEDSKKLQILLEE